MNVYLILLRLIHIGSGVFWAGAAVMVAAFIEPAVRATGPEGGRFMRQLVEQQRFALAMIVASVLNALSGALLYWTVSGHLRGAWIRSGPGLMLTIGSAAGFLAFVIGNAVNGPTAKQISALGQEIQDAGGPPTPAQMERMEALQRRMRTAGILDAVLLGIAVACMAVAKYAWW